MADRLQIGAGGLFAAVALAELGQKMDMPLPMALGALTLSGILGSVSLISLASELGEHMEEIVPNHLSQEPDPIDPDAGWL